MDKDFFEKATSLGVCSMMTGTENEEEILRLLLTPQGTEFCTKNNFPPMDMVRRFKGDKAESMGIYIEKDTNLHNPERLFLFGGNHTLKFDTAKRYNVILMHGAKAEVHASNYAVVFIKNAGGEVEIIKDKTALVL